MIRCGLRAAGLTVPRSMHNIHVLHARFRFITGGVITTPLTVSGNLLGHSALVGARNELAAK